MANLNQDLWLSGQPNVVCRVSLTKFNGESAHKFRTIKVILKLYIPVLSKFDNQVNQHY